MRCREREMETEETIKARKQDGLMKPGSMGSVQSLSGGLLSYALLSKTQRTSWRCLYVEYGY